MAKGMKLPNGYGSVYKLKDVKRRKPWRARVTAGWELNQETGKVKQKYLFLGSFETREDAMKALMDFNEHPIDTDKANITGITDIILCHDLDNIGGYKDKIMSVSQFNKYVRRNNRLGVYDTFNVRYIPVTYAAESVLLYVLYNCLVDIKYFINSKDTRALHNAMLRFKLNIDESKSIKDLREYLSRSEVIKGLTKEFNKENESNRDVLKLLLTDISISQIGKSGEDVLELLEKMNDFYTNEIAHSKDIININGKSTL